MPIQVECPSCRASIRVRDEHAGRRGRCPHCKAAFARAHADGRAGARRDARAGRARDDDGEPMHWPTRRARQRPSGRAPRRCPGVGVSARGVIEAAAPTAQDAHPPPGPRRLRRPDRAGPPHDPLPALGPDRRRGDGAAPAGVRGDHRPGRRRGGVPRDAPRIDPPARPGRRLKFAAVIYAAPLVAGAMVVALMIKPLFARPPRGPKAAVARPGRRAAAVRLRGRRLRFGRRAAAGADRGRLPRQRLGAPRRGPPGRPGRQADPHHRPARSRPASRSSSSPACSPTSSATSRRGRGCGSTR